MTQEEKELLLKDICARLPYGVHVEISWEYSKTDVYTSLEYYEFPNIDSLLNIFWDEKCISIKPYLRPMSSMTNNEMEDWYRQSKVDYDCEFKPEPTLSLEHCHLSIDWLNRYGFDYRGLIDKGVALEAPENMYVL